MTSSKLTVALTALALCLILFQAITLARSDGAALKIVPGDQLIPIENQSENELKKKKKSLNSCLENTNQLQHSLDQLTEQYDDEANYQHSDYKVGQFTYKQSDVFNYDIGKGEPSYHRFFSEFFDFYIKNRQSIPHPQRPYSKGTRMGIPEKIGGNVWKLDSEEILSENTLRAVLDTPRELIQDLKIKHANMLNAIPSDLPFPFYKGNGYVLFGEGMYTWQSLVNIQLLRKLGSVYPIELIINDEKDYDKTMCDLLLSSLNARCVLLSTVFGKESMDKLELGAYQFKSMSLLASSFENMFWFDSDALPLVNPDYLFDWDVYDRLGMVTWADVCRRTTSPDLFEIQGIQIEDEIVGHVADRYTDPKAHSASPSPPPPPPIDFKNDVNFHDRKGTPADWSTESGVMMIRKSDHFDVLLLSLYYNLDGPQGYFPLLSQFGPGEGDKETFPLAAHLLKKPFFQVTKSPDVGTPAVGKYWEGTNTLQAEPISFFKTLQNVVQDIQNDLQDGKQYDYKTMFHDKLYSYNTTYLYYHMHSPKWDPFRILEDRRAVNDKGHHFRNLGTHTELEDVELMVYEIMNESLCVKDWNFVWFDGKDMGRLCEFFQERLEFLKLTTWGN